MKINEHAWKLHPNVVASLDLWREAHAEEVFLYQAQETAVGPNGKLVVRRALHNRLAQQPCTTALHNQLACATPACAQETRPFILGLCPAATRDMFKECVHEGTMMADGTFGALVMWMPLVSRKAEARSALNQDRYTVTTLMGMDKHKHGLPGVHIIHSSSSAATLKLAFNSLRDYLGHDVQPSFVLIDDADAEIKAVQECEWGKRGCKVALCDWHVKRSWLKALIRTLGGAENKELRGKIFDDLQALQALQARRCEHAAAMQAHALLHRRRSGAGRGAAGARCVQDPVGEHSAGLLRILQKGVALQVVALDFCLSRRGRAHHHGRIGGVPRRHQAVVHEHAASHGQPPPRLASIHHSTSHRAVLRASPRGQHARC